ncbi:MAG: hypothetical protein J6568_02865 [Snodgrassella sp.]|nr:hypothetical protein [Snodgrassella sp.]
MQKWFFSDQRNRTPEQNELIAWRKELKQLRLEYHILQLAALIMAQTQKPESKPALLCASGMMSRLSDSPTLCLLSVPNH